MKPKNDFFFLTNKISKYTLYCSHNKIQINSSLCVKNPFYFDFYLILLRNFVVSSILFRKRNSRESRVEIYGWLVKTGFYCTNFRGIITIRPTRNCSLAIFHTKSVIYQNWAASSYSTLIFTISSGKKGCFIIVHTWRKLTCWCSKISRLLYFCDIL